MVYSPLLVCGEKKHWWLRTRKIAEKCIREAGALMATQEQTNLVSAINVLDSALALSPRLERALELKARCLLLLRRFKEVADMLQDYIPSLNLASENNSSSSPSSSSLSSHNNNSSQQLSRESATLLPSKDLPGGDDSVKCFSVSDLKRKVIAGVRKSCDKDGHWRYLVLGQACSHLGLMEDAVVLLQTGKRLASAGLRRQSVNYPDDSFSSSASNPSTDAGSISHLLAHIKMLLRRRTAALASMDAGLYAEGIRHFTKILNGRRGAPQSFLSECYTDRASAYRSAGRIAESISDCNRALALDPSSIRALCTRASLFETIRCLPDSLHDLEHLKLLYNSILRDRKLPGPAWKRHNVSYQEIPGKLCDLTVKIEALKERLGLGETRNVDYYALMGLRRGCSRSELERAHLLLGLKHKPDKAMAFMDRCEFVDGRDLDSVKDRAKISSLMLYRLIQRGYWSVMGAVMEEEENQRKKAVAQAVQAQQTLPPKTEDSRIEEPKSEFERNIPNWNPIVPSSEPKPTKTKTASQGIQAQNIQETKIEEPKSELERNIPNSKPILPSSEPKPTKMTVEAAAAQFQGVFCRDIAAVSNLLSQVGFNRPLPVKYEGLSC